MARCLSLVLLSMFLADAGRGAIAQGWSRHTIDDSGRGADGVRLADFDGDGLEDIVTGWEESGHIRLYVNPGPEKAKSAWPAVTVGRDASPEDAVPADVDGDGNLEIVSSHEGRTRAILVHRGPKRRDGESSASFRQRLLAASAWSSAPVAAAAGQTQWMFATPLAHNGRHTLAVGAKGDRALVGLLVPSPASGSAAGSPWHLVRLQPAGWIMSITAVDMNRDGREDLVVSDRKGARRGISILQRPGDEAFTDPAAWQRIEVGGNQHEVMFLDASPGRIDVATREGEWLRFVPGQGGTWQTQTFPNPAGLRMGKAVRRLAGGRDAGDPWNVFTFNTEAHPPDRGKPAVWLGRPGSDAVPIGEPPGGKFDLLELCDLDGDGDADVITCEERHNLGVLWYENPG